MSASITPRNGFAWTPPLDGKDTADLRLINTRLLRIRHETDILKRLRGQIMQRGRMAQRIKDGWKPHPAARVPRPTFDQPTLL